MSFLSAEELVYTLQSPTQFRQKLRGLAISIPRRKVGGVALCGDKYNRTAIGPEYESDREVPSLELFARLCARAAQIDEPSTYAGLLVSSRGPATSEADLLHPIQLKHYALHAQEYEDAIGGSIGALDTGRVSLELFARRSDFNPAPLRALHERAPRKTIANSIANSGLVTALVRFDKGGMVPVSGLHEVRRLF